MKLSADPASADPAPVAPSGLVFAQVKNVPERKVKGLPSRGQRGGPLTDAQARAARSRIKRWRLVDRAVGVTHADAACAFESLLAVEPMTPAQMHEGGIGPYARRRVATAQTGGDGETREFETQTGGGENGAGENARPVAAQCPDDLSARREDLEARSALEASGRGGGRSAAAVRREAAARKAAQWARATGHLAHSREKRLAGFLARAGADAEALLRERRPFFFGAGKTGGGARSAPDLMRTGASAALKPHAVEGAPGSLTAAYVALEEQEVTRGRRVAAAAFAPEDDAKGKRGGAARSSLLVAYAPRDARARGAAGRGVLLVWDLSAARRTITHAMTLEGSPTCVAWGPRPPGGQGVVLCGTEEGALCAWDLREPAQRARMGDAADSGDGEDAAAFSALAKHGTAFRRPSYSTEGKILKCLGSPSAAGDAFGEPRGALVSVAAAAAEGPNPPGVSDRERLSGRFAFHVLALDADGNVDAHLVSELPRREAEDAAMSDIGLRFGSRVRVTRAAAGIEYGDRKKKKTTAASRAFGMRVASLGGGAGVEFFVADDRGRVLHGARYGAAPLPRAFSVCDALDAGTAAAPPPRRATTSLDLHPSPTLLSARGTANGVYDVSDASAKPRLLLAALEGGTVALYRSDRSLALRRWDGFTSGSVVAVRWSLARPSLFFALDDACVVFAFDLLAADPAAPAHFEAFGKKEKIVSLELAEHFGAPGRDEPGQNLMCLGYDDGRVDVHAIAPEFARATPEEVRALEASLV